MYLYLDRSLILLVPISIGPRDSVRKIFLNCIGHSNNAAGKEVLEIAQYTL